MAFVNLLIGQRDGAVSSGGVGFTKDQLSAITAFDIIAGAGKSFVVHDPGQDVRFNFRGSRSDCRFLFHLRLFSPDTGLAAGRLVPLHSHIDPECFYVLEGKIEVLVLDDAPGWRMAGAGQSLLVADGVKHAVRNTAERAADLILATNNRFADFLAAAGLLVSRDSIPMVPPSPEDIQRMLRAAESWGYWVASPDDSASVVSRYTGDL